jgi:hypothetical protein
MDIQGKRVKRTRFVQTDRFVVALVVDAIILDEDPSEPCCTPEMVELIREVEHRARRGDKQWLMQHGRVYERVTAA